MVEVTAAAGLLLRCGASNNLLGAIIVFNEAKLACVPEMKGLCMVRKSIVLAVIAALMASSAEAALVTNIQGAVSVNSGDGYRPAENATVVAPGDRVRTGDGSADITYENGCTVKIGPGQTAIVLYAAPVCDGGLKDGAAADTGISTGTLLVGGLVVGGAVAGAIALSQPSKPASP